MTPEAQTNAPEGAISNMPVSALNIDEMLPMPTPNEVHMVDPQRITLDEAYNPRRYAVSAAKIIEMAQNIVSEGQIYPVILRKIHGKIVPIDGATRVKAINYANENKLVDKPLKVAAVYVDMEDAQSFLTAVSANTNRNEMTAIDHANTVRVLINEFGLSRKDVGKKMKKTQSWLTEHLQLAELRPAIQKKIHDGKIPYSSAVMLLGKEDAEQDEMIADIEGGASRSQIRKKAKASGKGKGKGKKGAKEISTVLTLKELRRDYESMAGLDLEEGEECKFDEQIQGLGVLLINHMDSKMGVKGLVNQIEKLYK